MADETVKIPGNSRLRDVEKYLRQNGFAVLPDNWNAIWVRDWARERLLDDGIRIVDQFRMEETYAGVHPDPHTRILLPGPLVCVLVWDAWVPENPK